MALHYNLQVSNVRIPGRFLLALACAPLLMGGACEKKPASRPSDSEAIKALDNTTAAPGPVDTTPLAGIDLGKLDADKTKLFYALVGSLKSPCGKAESLRASFTKDTACKRAPFAVRYVASLIEDEAPEQAVREAYGKKYEPSPPVKLDVSKAPREGAANGAIRIVEFFDYECPHCAAFKAVLDQVIADKGGDVTAYFLMFPIESKHPNSRSAAQAALAAHEQGKFKAMHDVLFAEQHHTRDDVMAAAKKLQLDVARFEKAYDAAGAQVTADLAQGEAAGVDSTPTVYFGDRKYDGPLHPKYLEMWIDEELAVNR